MTYVERLDIDQFLTEAMGECWHEMPQEFYDDKRGNPNFYHCTKCDLGFGDCGEKNNFFTWIGFEKLWKWAQKQDWWHKEFLYDRIEDDIQQGMIGINLIDPAKFAEATYTFLKEKS